MLFKDSSKSQKSAKFFNEMKENNEEVQQKEGGKILFLMQKLTSLKYQRFC